MTYIDGYSCSDRWQRHRTLHRTYERLTNISRDLSTTIELDPYFAVLLHVDMSLRLEQCSLHTVSCQVHIKLYFLVCGCPEDCPLSELHVNAKTSLLGDNL